VIDFLRIARFKCFERASLSIRPLTILTGINGGGKSTVLQSILLARLASTSSSRTIRLNGPYDLALGTAADVLHQSASDSIEVGFGRTATAQEWTYQLAAPEDLEALYLTAARIPDGQVPGISNSPGGFTYLCAERFGPREVLAVSALEPDDIGVGVHGEFTAQVLALRETRSVAARRAVRTELQHQSTDSPLLRLQTEVWVSEIIRPIRITAQLATNILASTVRFQEQDRYGQMIRPANMGFGVSYALPIIVAGLLTVPGDLLIVENPEAHLHPAGQSKLGRFLAHVAGAGAQVIVETHSDHVLNGARIAVADSTLSASEMIVHYFDRDGITEITINEKGELDHWPAGFFDQLESDLGRLARVRRRS
jgi:predicted ATPase